MSCSRSTTCGSRRRWKLYAAELLPAATAPTRLGYAADETDAMRSVRRAEALDTAGVQLDGLLP